MKLLRAQVGITKLTTKTDESHPVDDDEAIEESQEEVEDEDDQQLAEMGNEKAAPSEDEKNGSLHNVSQNLHQTVLPQAEFAEQERYQTIWMLNRKLEKSFEQFLWIQSQYPLVHRNEARYLKL